MKTLWTLFFCLGIRIRTYLCLFIEEFLEEDSEVKVSTLIGKQEKVLEVSLFTKEQLEQEYGYLMAQKMLQKLKEKEFISIVEYDKITALNCRSFSPYLCELMS